MDEQIKALAKKRGLIKASVTRFETFLKTNRVAERVGEIKVRINALGPALNEFRDINGQMQSLRTKDENEQEFVEFETNYFRIIGEAQSFVDEVNNSRQTIQGSATPSPVSMSGNSNNSVQIHQVETGVKLPQINLPSFSGNYADWVNFRDTFRSLIHENDKLDDVRKLHYLKSCIKGDAQRIISTFSMSADNYLEAWKLLERRYENKRLIVQNHIQQIFNLPHLSKDVSIRKFVDQLNASKQALKVLERPVDKWDDLLIYIITSKFDAPTYREWENFLNNKTEIPSMSKMEEFLFDRCNFVESVEFNKSNNNSNDKSHQSNKPKNQRGLLSHAVTYDKPKCKVCGNNHYLYQCADFIKLTVNDRIQECRKQRLCLNCLRPNHMANECNSNFTCKQCHKKHNTLLHLPEKANSGETSGTATVSSNCSYFSKGSQVLLSTAMIFMEDSCGNFKKCRALLDVGSQTSFVTRSLCNKLNLNLDKANIVVSGINSPRSTVSCAASVVIKSRLSPFNMKLKCLVLPKITDKLPLSPVNKHLLNIPSNITLADPDFHKRGGIDVLLGADVFWEILKPGQIKANSDHPFLQETELGWVTGGRVLIQPVGTTNQSKIACLSTLDQLNAQVAKFWEIENMNDVEYLLSPEEQACEDHFASAHYKDETGRFVVSLPFKQNVNKLGSAEEHALRRFYSLERKMSRDNQLKVDYSNFVTEYKDLNHMELVKDVRAGCVLPHHAVYKQSSQTTKIRVVFDASAKTDSGYSLNDTLMVGPNLQQDIFSIVLRFRTYRIVLTADIEKFYRQIWVRPEDQIYQQILWRDNPSEQVERYQLKTVTYGTASASYLATKCLHQLASEFVDEFPIAHNIIKNDFYVDDLLTGADSIEEANKIIKQVDSVLASAGFKLRQWASNEQSLLANNKISAKNKDAKSSISLDKQNDSKTLGLNWNFERDTLRYQVQLQYCNNENVTKRSILSKTCQLFDPLGLIGPLIIVPKILIQKLWSKKLDWDETVPEATRNEWYEFTRQMQLLQTFEIPRMIISNNDMINIEIHGFSDASEVAYGCSIYLRVTDNQNQIETSLMCSKSRVAPLKTLSIPRLELSAALLLARLTKKIQNSLRLNVSNVFYWTDSEIVLAWLDASPSKWKTFVANRVSEMQTLTDREQWHHVKSEDNPADIISRGTFAESLINSPLWWEGPTWLKLECSQWPCDNKSQLDSVPEKKGVISLIAQTQMPSDSLPVITKFSRFFKLQRVMAYVLRFINNCKNKDKIRGNLTVSELNVSKTVIIRSVQRECFKEEIIALQKSGIAKQLKSLNIFLDSNTIIRVGGRLNNNKSIPYDKRHPIILPKKHHITKIIVRDFHVKNLHAGHQATLAAVREVYWPIGSNYIVRHVLKNCVTCFKTQPRIVNQLMGNLPYKRIEPSRAFLNSGVDYCGPILIKESRGRSKKSIKSYIAVFVCFATKAIHLELVLDCTTDSFLAALRRFISRRGLVSHLHSDNATNFTGANRELKSLFESAKFQSKVVDTLANDKVTWHFIPANSPHMGGIWEAGVKIIKRHLQKILRNTLITYEEMYTVLTQIEAAVNSRPLNPLSHDPEDLQALTPGHFLIGDRLTSIVEPYLTALPTNRLSRWEYVQQLQQHFWQRWSREYLTQLQQRSKWQSGTTEIQVDSMVLLVDKNLHPLQWKLGRVTKTHPGADNIVRVVSVKTANGTFVRAVNKVAFLPIEELGS